MISFSEPKSHSAPLLTSMISLNYRYFLLLINGHTDSYRLALMNISNLRLLLVPILRANRAMETLM